MSEATVPPTPAPDHEAISADLRHILRQWYGAPSHRIQSKLSIFSDYGKPQATERIRELVLNLLEKLKMKEPLAAQLLRERFLDDEMVYVLANRHNLSENMIYRRQREALAALAEIAWAEEHRARMERVNRALRLLPEPTYHTLFGVDRPLQRLHDVLVKPDLPWLIAVDGLGGIGKTSLVDYLVRNVSQTGQFLGIAWVSARRRSLALSGRIVEMNEPALYASDLLDQLIDTLAVPLTRPFNEEEAIQALRQRFAEPHIIVIDNMETVVDYKTILPTLRRLANPSKVIITSRQSLGDEQGVHCTSLSELDLIDATQLLKNEARVRGIDVLIDAQNEVYGSIYRTVGGNPLALKIVAGLVRVRDVPSVLDDLKEGRAGRADALYTYIYQEAWELLAEPARRTLLTMPLIGGEGATFDHLASITGLPPDDLSQALDILIAHSLVYVGGTVEERRYHIHGLTETFLRHEVAKWQ